MEAVYPGHLQWLYSVITRLKDSYDQGDVWDAWGNRYDGEYDHILILSAMLLGKDRFGDPDLIFQLNDQDFGWLADINKKEEYKNQYYVLSAEDKGQYLRFAEEHIPEEHMGGFRRVHSRTRKTRSRKEKSRSRKTRTKKSRH